MPTRRLCIINNLSGGGVKHKSAIRSHSHPRPADFSTPLPRSHPPTGRKPISRQIPNLLRTFLSLDRIYHQVGSAHRGQGGPPTLTTLFDNPLPRPTTRTCRPSHSPRALPHPFALRALPFAFPLPRRPSPIVSCHRRSVHVAFGRFLSLFVGFGRVFAPFFTPRNGRTPRHFPA